jgi:hypothetical protein
VRLARVSGDAISSYQCALHRHGQEGSAGFVDGGVGGGLVGLRGCGAEGLRGGGAGGYRPGGHCY